MYTWKLCMHDYYSKKNFRKLFNSKLSRSSLLPWCYVLELRVYCSDPGTYMSRSCLYQDTRPPPSITKQLKDRSVNTAVISLWHRSEWLLVLCTSCPTCGLWGLILPISVHFPSLIRYPAVTSPKSPTISRQISVYTYSHVTMKKLPLYYTCLTYRVCGRVFGRRRGASRCPRAVHRQSPYTLPHTNKIQSEFLNL